MPTSVQAVGPEVYPCDYGPFASFVATDVADEGDVLYELDMRILATNVCSLENAREDENVTLAGAATEGGTFFLGKDSLIQAQFKHENVTMYGALETRTKQGTRHTSDFLVFASGAPKGKFGVHLCLFKTRPYVKSGDNELFF